MLLRSLIINKSYIDKKRNEEYFQKDIENSFDMYSRFHVMYIYILGKADCLRL